MIECFSFIDGDRFYQGGQSAPVKNTSGDTVSLSFAQRQKSRAQATTINGNKVSWFLERGYVLKHGDALVGNSGEQIHIIAAAETLSEVTSTDTLQLTRVAYHLGNRHVPLQIIKDSLSYQHDHVLDDMVRGLGLSVTCVEKPFQPENGAYHSHSTHSHDGEQEHSHSHPHEHHHA